MTAESFAQGQEYFRRLGNTPTKSMFEAARLGIDFAKGVVEAWEEATTPEWHWEPADPTAYQPSAALVHNRCTSPGEESWGELNEQLLEPGEREGMLKVTETYTCRACGAVYVEVKQEPASWYREED